MVDLSIVCAIACLVAFCTLIFVIALKFRTKQDAETELARFEDTLSRYNEKQTQIQQQQAFQTYINTQPTSTEFPLQPLYQSVHFSDNPLGSVHFSDNPSGPVHFSDNPLGTVH